MNKRAMVRLCGGLLAGVFLLSLVFGCGDDDPPTRPSASLISKDTGGTASLGNLVTVTVPPEAISEDAEIQISQTDAVPALPEGYGFVSPAYEVKLSTGQIIDTIWVVVTYADAMLPAGQLEASLLTGRTDGQSWVFENPSLETGQNRATIGALTQSRWAVVWKTQTAREAIGAIINQVVGDLGGDLGQDIELSLGAADRADVLDVFQTFKTHYENASAGDAVVESAVANLINAVRAIEDDDRVVLSATGEQFTSAFLALGRAVGYDIEAGQEIPPRVRIGSRRWLPPAFLRLFTYGAGLSSDAPSSGAGRVQDREEVMQNFYVQLNYAPAFGGLTYLDFPEGYSKDSLTLAREVTGVYRMALTRVSTQANLAVRFDYLRDRGIALNWPAEAEVLLFNFPDANESITSIAFAVDFRDVLVDFRTIHENPFSASAQADSLGSWLYFGLPASALLNLRKQDGQLHIHVVSGSAVEQNSFPLPVSRRPLLSYGDWIEPTAVTDLTINEYWGNSIRLSWTATGNDYNEGFATWYDLRYAAVPITDENWDEAGQFIGEPTPAANGSAEEFVALPYDLAETTYLGLRVFDQDYNYSTISNVIQVNNLSELEVSVPDNNLQAALRTLAGKPTGALTGADLAGHTELLAIGRGIIALNGLEYLFDVQALDLQSNGLIKNLVPLSHLIDLRILRLNGNSISDISPLAQLKQLQVLDLSSNSQLSNIAGLAGLMSLDSLNVQYCNISNARTLSDLRNLSYLNLGNNQIRDMNGLEKLRGIKTLLLNNNRLQNLTILLENPGWGAGDTLDIRGNTYVLYEWATRNVEIPELERRGVTVLRDGN
jgi:hypothetical protein